MKKTLTTIVMLALAIGAVMAQPKAVGLRAGYNFEASYQHSVGAGSGMIEVDAGISPFLYSKAYYFDTDGNRIPITYRYGRVQVVALYDWLMHITNNLNWYVGAGVGVSWGYGAFFNDPHYNSSGNLTTYRRLGLPIGLQIGLEYNFDIPLNLSLDWRPMINLFGLRQGDLVPNLLNVAVGVRYKF